MKRYDGRVWAILFSATMLWASPAEAGSITGQVAFEGEAPERAELNTNADPACAAMHETPLLSDAVLVNDNGTLRNVFVYLKEGLEDRSFDTPESPVVLDQVGCSYTPHVFGVQAGQPVEIRNSDDTLHNVHAVPTENREFNLGMPIKGMKIKKKFKTPEVMVKIKCDVHPWMACYAGVLPHPFFAVTDAQGRFVIRDVPDGDYVVAAWHEEYGEQTGDVRVEEDAAEISFSFSAE